MTADSMLRLFRYNAWANGKMLAALAAAPAEEYLRDRNSSHGGMHGTMLHVVYAQHLWLLRWMGKPQETAIARRADITSLAELRNYWEEVDGATSGFLGGKLTDGFLGETFRMETTQGAAYTHVYGESMLHLIIHSGYHRGQVTTLLRQAGQVPPDTDYIIYERERRSSGGEG